ncbi:rhomboid family intramembrane serine protease [candidate division FCPU426 bacterium]|nr:rhomboid family intramembrane serine protease [candidate division FCPU426 bacterium]
MIPLKDNIPSHTVPIINYLLILANAAVFMYELKLGPEVIQWVEAHGFIPAAFQQAASAWESGSMTAWAALLGVSATLLTSLFLHGSWWHFLGNMLYLWVFGDNVEDRMGHGRYLVFYLLCGVTANLAHYLVQPGLQVPTIGASGAIAGVLGAYFILYPKARVLTLVPIVIFLQFFQLPAFFFLAVWFLQQYLMSILTASMPGQGGVAWWAHIGGFGAGVLLVFFFQRPGRRPTSSVYWKKKQNGYIRWN